ncbi:amidohydrolase family protein [Flagellimonas iocasae]|uniref:Amidohydrolase family protein n=1 Tax=Flagellimonas iocasae TaxID=2055905 RepID=A0ABW4XW83_9FLAO
MKRILILGLLALSVGCYKTVKYDTVIKNVGLFNGYEDQGTVYIAINSDTIAYISTEELQSDQIIDGTGKYIIPGMVNAHVHVSETEQLRQGYPLGIMYLLNMHTGLEVREAEWKKGYQDSTGYSILYGAGHAATVPGGHPNQYSPDMETISDSLSIEDWLNHRIEKNVDYIKIIREHHEWMGYPPLPTLSYEQIKELIDRSHEKGYKVVVHANTAEEMMKIAEFKPDGFVHMLDYKEDLPVSDKFYNSLVENDIFVIPTGGMSLKSMDGAPPFMIDWVANNLLDVEERTAILKKMYEKGVLIVAGTDAQEGQMDFGADYFLELELYQRAGLTNLDILKTATGNAAKAFDLPIGELTVGSKANFVLLKDSPLNDISNLKKVEQVWKNGKWK